MPATDTVAPVGAPSYYLCNGVPCDAWRVGYPDTEVRATLDSSMTPAMTATDRVDEEVSLALEPPSPTPQPPGLCAHSNPGRPLHLLYLATRRHWHWHCGRGRGNFKLNTALQLEVPASESGLVSPRLSGSTSTTTTSRGSSSTNTHNSKVTTPSTLLVVLLGIPSRAQLVLPVAVLYTSIGTA